MSSDKLDKKLTDSLALCLVSLGAFCRIIMPEQFENAFGPVREDILRVADSSKRKKAVQSSRGIGKTTITRARAARAILFKEYHFIIWISKSATAAELQTENLKMSLMSNTLIRTLFGELKVAPYDGGETQFSKKSWIANGHTLVMPRGMGQQVRGLNWNGFRPDLIIFDDLEDDLLIENADNRTAWRTWFWSQPMKCMPRHHKKWEIFYIDTCKHEDSILQDLLKDPTWESCSAPIVDADVKTRDFNLMSQDEVDVEFEEHRKKGILDIFARELQCIPLSPHDMQFTPDLFQHYSETDVEISRLFNSGRCETIVIGDPAKTAKMHNAESGIIVWTVDLNTGSFYLRYAEGRHEHPDEFIQRLVDIAVQFRAPQIGIEVTGLNEYVTHPLQNKILERNLSIELIELHSKSGRGEFAGPLGQKKARVGSMLNYYRQGMIKHNIVGTKAYEVQLMAFPRPPLWDLIDPAGYITEILDTNLRFYRLADQDTTEADREELEAEYYGLTSDEDEYDPDFRLFRKGWKERACII